MTGTVETPPASTPSWAKDVDKLKTTFQNRLAELEPMLTEYDDIQDKLVALDPSLTPSRNRRRTTSSTRRVARGEHDNRFLGIIAEAGAPMTVADVIRQYKAKGFEVQSPYLYKVVERLVNKGDLIKVDGKKYTLPQEPAIA